MPFLTRSPISIDHLVREVASPGYGGTCVFVGTVRSGPGDGDVSGIEYSAYEPMVEAELERIRSDVQARWPHARTALSHRLGSIPTGEASIVIVAAAPHRAEAFDSCRFLIEAVKQRLPIWKKETRADGTTQWVDPAGRPATAGPS